jgi:heme-degrading monooxygenase HmoA
VYVVVWSFDVADEQRAAFERAYGPDGAWARLFIRSPGYLGTELLHDAEHPDRWLTVDRWVSLEAYAAFHETWKADYEALDDACAALTRREDRVGAFEVP